MTDRNTLIGLLGQRVTVTRPVLWSTAQMNEKHAGVLVGVETEPRLILDTGAEQISLPQTYTVEAIPPCPGHGDCDRCDVLDPCPCCGLTYRNGTWTLPTVIHDAMNAQDEHTDRVREALLNHTPEADTDGNVAIPKIEQSAEACCACGSTDIAYRNYRNQPLCDHCANCACGHNPCTRPAPLEIPRDTAETLHAMLGDLLGETAPDPEPNHVIVPADTLQRLIKVASHVSLGRSFVGVDEPYPDATARYALGELHDHDLLKLNSEKP